MFSVTSLEHLCLVLVVLVSTSKHISWHWDWDFLFETKFCAIYLCGLYAGLGMTARILCWSVSLWTCICAHMHAFVCMCVLWVYTHTWEALQRMTFRVYTWMSCAIYCKILKEHHIKFFIMALKYCCHLRFSHLELYPIFIL